MRRRSSDLQAGRVSLDLSLPALPAARTGGGSTESQGWSGKCSVNPEGVGPRGVSGSPKQSGRTCGGWAVPGEDGRTSPAVWQRQVSWSCCPWRGQRGEGAGACQGRSGAWSGERGRTAGAGGAGGTSPSRLPGGVCGLGALLGGRTLTSTSRLRGQSGPPRPFTDAQADDLFAAGCARACQVHLGGFEPRPGVSGHTGTDALAAALDVSCMLGA